MHERRLRRRQHSAVMFCLLMTGLVVAITFAVAQRHEADLLEIDERVLAAWRPR